MNAINHVPNFDRVAVICDPAVVSGPTTELTRWGVTVNGAGPIIPTSIQIAGGNIRLINPAWGLGTTAEHVVYNPGPNRFVSADNRELLGFSLGIPFP